MKTALLTVAALTTVAACSSGDLATTLVIGDFGGSAHVIATRTSVQFELPCAGTASASHALRVDASGAFSLSAVLRNYATNRDTLPTQGSLAATITGHVIGETIAFAVATPDYAYGPTGHFEARIGVPDSSNAICRA